MHLTLIKH